VRSRKNSLPRALQNRIPEARRARMPRHAAAILAPSAARGGVARRGEAWREGQVTQFCGSLPPKKRHARHPCPRASVDEGTSLWAVKRARLQFCSVVWWAARPFKESVRAAQLARRPPHECQAFCFTVRCPVCYHA